MAQDEQAFLERVQRARADVAEDDPEGAQRESPQAAGMSLWIVTVKRSVAAHPGILCGSGELSTWRSPWAAIALSSDAHEPNGQARRGG
jgi:hypothetical protein